MIALVHAYSRRNAGDGLLVDLSVERLARAGVDLDSIVVVALDPISFADLPHVVAVGTPDRAANIRTLGAGISALSIAGLGRHAPGGAASALHAAETFVAVGGGYLRAGSAVNRLGTAINHLPQLVTAARSGKPSIYLPQSIGPLHGTVGTRVRRALTSVTEVHVRDDRSLTELAAAGNVIRTPDLAVLAVAERLPGVAPRQQATKGTPVLVARALPNTAGFEQRLVDLQRRCAGSIWAVQAEGSASKSDRTFYEQLGVRAPDGLQELLAAGAGPVVSVRLHGAVQAILAGVPAIHLGYERKSWGAYEDLGLGRWLHDARSFDPAAVARQVQELADDAEPFWTAVAERAPSLVESSRRLDESIRRIVTA